MATLAELVDLDSGVASSEATPESTTAGEESVKEVTEEEAKELTELEDTVVVSSAAVSAAEDKSKVVATLAAAVEDEEEEEEDVDESLVERVWGLTEMFPDSLRSGCVNTVSSSANLVKSVYSLSRQVVWIAVSTSILLFAPVMFELERLNVEEMMKQDRNRLVLGPGSAMSGPPSGPGLIPPPPAR